jgi:hypothetical protein
MQKSKVPRNQLPNQKGRRQPLATCILLSVLLTVLMWVLKR